MGLGRPDERAAGVSQPDRRHRPERHRGEGGERATACPRHARASRAEMARIVFTTWGSLGDLHPFLALAPRAAAPRSRRRPSATLAAWRDNVERRRPRVPADTARHHTARIRSPARSVRKILDPMTGRGVPVQGGVGTAHPRRPTMIRWPRSSGADLLVSHQLPPVASIDRPADGHHAGCRPSSRRSASCRRTIRRRSRRRRFAAGR